MSAEDTRHREVNIKAMDHSVYWLGRYSAMAADALKHESWLELLGILTALSNESTKALAGMYHVGGFSRKDDE